jgi:hypothetical protein
MRSPAVLVYALKIISPIIKPSIKQDNNVLLQKLIVSGWKYWEKLFKSE